MRVENEKNVVLTCALSGDRHAAKTWLGGVGSFRKCLTSSSPTPRLLPVIKTDFGDNMILILLLMW